jgi:rod shape-determining protein MreB
MEVRGHDIITGIPREMQVSSVEIREALKSPVDKIIKAVLNTLEKTPPELSSDIYDKGIIMTGGSALLRGLDERIRRETNLPVCVSDEPLTRVAKGALIVAENLDKYSQVLLGSSRNSR